MVIPVELRDVEWVHGLFLFRLVLGKMQLPHAKLGLILYSLDNLLQKNVIVLFFGNQISKWRSFEKRAIFDLLFTFFSHHSRVIFGPPVTTESRGRFESGFGYFEVFKTN